LLKGIVLALVTTDIIVKRAIPVDEGISWSATNLERLEFDMTEVGLNMPSHMLAYWPEFPTNWHLKMLAR